MAIFRRDSNWSNGIAESNVLRPVGKQIDPGYSMQERVDRQRYAILFVDDEEKSRKYFRRFFEREFYILTAAGVTEALDILEQHSTKIAVLVSDQRMPERRGIELLKAVCFMRPEIVRLLTTAFTDMDEAIEAVNSGEIFRYIIKPWDLEALHKSLHDAMNLYLSSANVRGHRTG